MERLASNRSAMIDERIKRWLQPLWSGRTVEDEPVFFVTEPGEAYASAPLLFPPTGPVRLAAANGSVAFEEGRDFVRDGGALRLTDNSRVPFKTWVQLRPPPGAPQSIGAARDGSSHLFFSEGHVFHDLQAVATYRHGGPWSGPKPASAARQLPRTRARLRRREPLSLVVLGDSISAGGNASGVTGAPPHQPAYPELVRQALAAKFGGAVNLTNLSVGGMASDWAISQADRAIAAAPDLMVIAFGMNDASGQRPPIEFRDNITRVMADVRKGRPGVEFLMVATMTGNAMWKYSSPELYPQYRDILRPSVGHGVALADVTGVWEALLTRKRYYDLTGNGVNHPNDFGHRVYAQVVLATLGAL